MIVIHSDDYSKTELQEPKENETDEKRDQLDFMKRNRLRLQVIAIDGKVINVEE